MHASDVPDEPGAMCGWACGGLADVGRGIRVPSIKSNISLSTNRRIAGRKLQTIAQSQLPNPPQIPSEALYSQEVARNR